MMDLQGKNRLKETWHRMCRNSMNIFKMRTILDLVITIRSKFSNQFWHELIST